MNYWPAEVTSLSDLHGPLFDLVDNAREDGRHVAKSPVSGTRFRHPSQHRRLGTMRFRLTACGPESGRRAERGSRCTSGITTTSPAIVSFCATRAYPGPEGGRRVPARLSGARSGRPSGDRSVDFSGESIQLPDGTSASLTMGPYMDTEIADALFGRTIQSSEILGVDADFPGISSDRATQAAAAENRQVRPACRNGWRTTKSGIPVTDTSLICSRCIPAIRSRLAARQNWRRPRASRFERRLAPAAGGLAGVAHGSSISGRGWKRAIARTRISSRCSRTRRSRTCSTVIHRFRSMATSAGRPASSRCCCSRTPARSLFFPRLPSAWPSGSVTGLRARGGIGVDITWAPGRTIGVRLRPDVDSEQVIRPPKGGHVVIVTGPGIVRFSRSPDGSASVTLRGGVPYSVVIAPR